MKYTTHSNHFRTLHLSASQAIRLIEIEGDTFVMGDDHGPLNERPAHEVTISQFFLSETPITQEQWMIVADMPRVNIDLDALPSNHYTNDNMPVTDITWKEAVEFCRRLTKEGYGDLRLPTEAEWEYACRAGTKGARYFDEDITDDHAYFNDGKRKHPCAVHCYVPNPFGLYQMFGNVFEWCEDTFDYNYANAPTDGTAWVDITETRRIYRGGSFLDSKHKWSATTRESLPSTRKGCDLGFRIALSF